jgi:acetyl esterase
VTTRDFTVPGPAGSIAVRAYTPPDLPWPSPALVYFHGGGWVTGSVATHDPFCRLFAQKIGARIFSVEYRLAPEHKFPAAFDDAVAAFRWIASHAEELGADPKKIGVAGDSAGGNLSAVVSQKTAREPLRPALQVLLYPAVDARCGHASHATFGTNYFLTSQMIEWYLGHYLARDEERLDPTVSPLLAADFRGLSTALVYTAGFDPLRDEAREYCDRLSDAGVRARYVCQETLAHGFVLMGGAVDAARRAVDEIARDVRAELHPS